MYKLYIGCMKYVDRVFSAKYKVIILIMSEITAITKLELRILTVPSIGSSITSFF